MSLFKKLLLYCLSNFCVLTTSSQAVNSGDVAPDFSLLNQDNVRVSLKDVRGKMVVLFFYPKNNTPGCTKQVCNLRDGYEYFRQNDIALIGINYDTPVSHKQFKERYNLPTILLSDADGTVAKIYGAWSHWWHYFAPARITFIIDEQGIVRHILSDVDVINHAEQIKQLLKPSHLR
jgi:thioredoxin-dependent peroxiredoxin